MSFHPSIPESLWSTVPPEAQAAILAVIAALEKRIAELEQRLNRNSTNSSRSPSSDPPAVKVKRRPPPPPSGRNRGGPPGHQRHCRALVPPEQLRETFEVKPARCKGGGAALRGEDPDPLRHQVAEIPPVRPDVDEYRLHRGPAPVAGTSTRAELPACVPPGPFGPRLRAILVCSPARNNAAERALRHAVLRRKSSGGTASEWVSRFVERVLSVVATCRQQGRNVLEFLAGCFRAHQEGRGLPSLLFKPIGCRPLGSAR